MAHEGHIVHRKCLNNLAIMPADKTSKAVLETCMISSGRS